VIRRADKPDLDPIELPLALPGKRREARAPAITT